jgi:hypothetical protein
MKRSITLTKKEIDEALADYVEKNAGFRPGSIRLVHMPGDRPFDADYWSATATEPRNRLEEPCQEQQNEQPVSMMTKSKSSTTTPE